ncbi:ubiquitin-like protein Pup [Actinomyces howellii]|uniref:Prokaryotic ubiquitin-like protein Pup n=1 Tax=Actinomyces howellii TaxID=52771 RepID=A0A3S4R9R2_9ACTO|nr:ubiquitin-like protein Pup [Actinomyces howellii]VEG26314.1 Bacterial ubiquitin-like modifier [Actinomyces howellii]
MTQHEQIRPSAGPGEETPAGPAGSGQARVVGVDDILDQIDTVLETNAAAFVEGFVQKGGQ